MDILDFDHGEEIGGIEGEGRKWRGKGWGRWVEGGGGRRREASRWEVRRGTFRMFDMSCAPPSALGWRTGWKKCSELVYTFFGVGE